MFNKLFRKIEKVQGSNMVSAEVIHAEVEAAEDIFIKQIEAFINQSTQQQSEIKIVEQEERKSKLLKDLGFENSELVKSINDRKLIISNIDKEIENNQKVVGLFQEYKNTYPFEKVMPFSTFEKVMEKYSLIYAPNTVYIKDVPEKNLLEIKNAKPLCKEHAQKPLIYATEIKHNLPKSSALTKALDEIEKSKHIRFSEGRVSKKDVVHLVVRLRDDPWSDKRIMFNSTYISTSRLNDVFEKAFNNKEATIDNLDAEWLSHNDYANLSYVITQGLDEFRHTRFKRKDLIFSIDSRSVEVIKHDTYSAFDKMGKVFKKHGLKDIYHHNTTFEEIERSGIFISAPKSHFDLSKLSAVGNYGYYANVKPLRVVETKDPIAFQFLEGTPEYPEGFVRILSKWGTDCDQSYLDAEVQHEILN